MMMRLMVMMMMVMMMITILITILTTTIPLIKLAKTQSPRVTASSKSSPAAKSHLSYGAHGLWWLSLDIW